MHAEGLVPGLWPPSLPCRPAWRGVERALVWIQWTALSPHPPCFLPVHPPPPGFLGPSQEHSAYQTIDSPEAPEDPYAGLEGKGHSPQGY